MIPVTLWECRENYILPIVEIRGFTNSGNVESIMFAKMIDIIEVAQKHGGHLMDEPPKEPRPFKYCIYAKVIFPNKLSVESFRKEINKKMRPAASN